MLFRENTSVSIAQRSRQKFGEVNFRMFPVFWPLKLIDLVGNWWTSRSSTSYDQNRFCLARFTIKFSILELRQKILPGFTVTFLWLSNTLCIQFCFKQFSRFCCSFDTHKTLSCIIFVRNVRYTDSTHRKINLIHFCCNFFGAKPFILETCGFLMSTKSLQVSWHIG